jgi:excisionase family DNA binding protein
MFGIMVKKYMETNLLTPADVAEILRVSKAKAYALLKRGEIPSVRIGKPVRVRREDLEEYINDKAGSSTPHSAETADDGLSHGDTLRV